MTLATRINKWKFDRAASNILNTRAIGYDIDPSVVIVTMLGKDSVVPYLLAIKSFLYHFCRGKVEIINDGSLEDSDLSLIRHHIGDFSLVQAAEINTGKCPTYISWKRLHRIVKLCEQSYVIQLDSDTVTLGCLVDVDRHVRSNQSYLIGGPRWQTKCHPEYMAALGRRWNQNHVQSSAERSMTALAYTTEMPGYVRGCAGFAGYAKGFAGFSDLERFSVEMESLIGSQWRDWGSEQTATLMLLSMSSDTMMLPWPLYQNFGFPDGGSSTLSYSSLIHFIGTYRYASNAYAICADRVYNQLS